MLRTFAETSSMIKNGKYMLIAGSESLLRTLPEGNWIGGSTEYFMTNTGGCISDNLFYIEEIPFNNCKISLYDKHNIENITSDGFESGYTVVILPFDSEIHKAYAKYAPSYKDIYLKNVVGWIAGRNLDNPYQTPIVVDGSKGCGYSDKGVAIHVEIPNEKAVNIGIINIFEPSADSPIITFDTESFTVETCFVNGVETNLASYISENGINPNFPIIGDYSGTGVNVSFKEFGQGKITLYAPVFKGINYKFASPVENYAEEFKRKMLEHTAKGKLFFSCNCILNFVHGELEGKTIEQYGGPITFGEVAFQVLNQTLVYLEIA